MAFAASSIPWAQRDVEEDDVRLHPFGRGYGVGFRVYGSQQLKSRHKALHVHRHEGFVPTRGRADQHRHRFRVP
jgi:hypothetical protein